MRATIAAAVTAVLLSGGVATAADPFPELVPLPDGFQPEGIAVGAGTTFFVGSIPTGAVYRGDLRTGMGDVLVPPSDRAAIGLDADRRGRLFVAGGPLGQAFVYDARTGASLAVYELAGAPTFINDVVVTGKAAWFTDSFNPVLYRLPLGPGGRLPSADAVEVVPLSGDYVHVPGEFNLNGIDATPSGGQLVVVQSVTGTLFRVDPGSGAARAVDLGGDVVTNGDGILLDGTRLFVVRNVQNRIAVVELTPDLAAGALVAHLEHPALDVPTTIAEHGHALYAVNARFGVVDPTAHYEAVRIEKP